MQPPPPRQVVVFRLLSIYFLSIALSPIVTDACQQEPASAFRTLSIPALKMTTKLLKPINQPLTEPQPGEWLDRQKESGQSFSQYLRIRPIVLTPRRNKLYVQPIGQFNPKQLEIIQLSSEYLSIYFSCPVEVLETKSEDGIPENAQRNHPTQGTHQLLTSYVLEKQLAPELPDDAFALIAFTSSDLWPGDGWNFVFGYASFRERVGVWSLSRFGDPARDPESFRRCLERTCKLATHETGHMFSIKHCTKYSCNMQGSNSLRESDSQPIHLCPECHAKIIFATKADPVNRIDNLIRFSQEHGFNREIEFLKKAKEILKN